MRKNMPFTMSENYKSREMICDRIGIAGESDVNNMKGGTNNEGTDQSGYNLDK